MGFKDVIARIPQNPPLELTRPAIHHAAPRATDLSGSDQLAAETPDASPQAADRIIRVVVHAIVLLALLAFIGYYCIWPVLAFIWN